MYSHPSGVERQPSASVGGGSELWRLSPPMRTRASPRADARTRIGDPFTTRESASNFARTEGKKRPRKPCKSDEISVSARDASRSGEVKLVDAQWTSPAADCTDPRTERGRPRLRFEPVLWLTFVAVLRPAGGRPWATRGRPDATISVMKLFFERRRLRRAVAATSGSATLAWRRWVVPVDALEGRRAVATAGCARWARSPTAWCSRPRGARGRPHGERCRPVPPRGGVLPPGLLLAPRRPGMQGAEDRLSGARAGVPGSVATPRATGHPPRGLTRPATSSHRRATARSRRSCTSAGTTARPRRRTRRCTRRSTAAGRSRDSTGPEPARSCTTDDSRCDPTGRVSSPAWSTWCWDARRWIRSGSCSWAFVRRSPRTAGRVGRAAVGGDDRRPRPVRHRRVVEATARRPVGVARRPDCRCAVRLAAGEPRNEDVARSAHGDPRHRQPACVLGRHAPLQLR